MEKNKLKVLIDGKEYTVVSEMPVKDIQEVAYLVDSKINEIRKSDCGLGLSTVMVSVLSALNVAEDYIKLTRAREADKSEFEKLQGSHKKLEAEYVEFKQLQKEYARLQSEYIKLETILKSRGINPNDKI